LNQSRPTSILYQLFSIFLVLLFAVGVILVWLYIFKSSAEASESPIASQQPLNFDSITNQETVTFSPTPINTYLSNPGIGLQYDPTVRNPTIPETVVYAPRQDISWNLLNPQENEYRWDILDAYLQEAVAQGKMFSFRVYTMRGEDYDGSRVPQWVLNKGLDILPSGDPNYHSCIYQDEWAKFVEALRIRYDGNPAIAYIDISGYSAFNEWSWNDDFTEWDFQWEEAYENGTPSPSDFTTLDGQARRRLVDIFVGGSFFGHQCTQPDGTIAQVDYSYPGFQSTQLVMPYAGIRQSTQYVVSKNADVGFRFDCLGNGDIGSADDFRERLSNEISQTWPVAPVIYEFCGGLGNNYNEIATDVLQLTHGTLVHTNDDVWGDQEKLLSVISSMGYRYELVSSTYSAELTPGISWKVETIWKNVGYSPSYPRMGQAFSLHYYLLDGQGAIAADLLVPAEISAWMPADPLPSDPPQYIAVTNFNLPEDLLPGTYTFMVGIIDAKSERPINLAIEGRNASGLYSIGTVTVISK